MSMGERMRRIVNGLVARAVLGLPRQESAPGPIRRFGWIVLGLVVLYAGLAARLITIQAFGHRELSVLAEKQHRIRFARPHRRGNIYDRYGAPLVISYSGWDLCIRVDIPEGTPLPSRARRARIIGRALDRPATDVLARMEKARANGETWLQVARGLEDPGVRDLARRHGAWMSLTHATVRMQPRFPLANGLLGRFGNRIVPGQEARSLAGLEESLDPILSGVDARIAGARDGRGRALALGRENRVLQPGLAGSDVYLTLDCEVQEVAERVLDQIMSEYRPVPGAGAVVLDAATGEVLALASRPTSTDPKEWPFQGDGRLDSCPWVLPMTVRFPPGSTFKPFTVGEALSGPNPVRMDDLVDCGHPVGTRGKVRVGARRVGNYKEKRHGNVTVEEALYRSYNVGMARLADGLGLERMIGLLERLGFHNDAEGGFSVRISNAWAKVGRRPGMTSPPRMWRPGISNIAWSFGQEMQLTLVDLASAYTAIATDGRIRRPTLIKDVVRPAGHARPGPVLAGKAVSWPRVFSADTAARLRQALNKAVVGEGGTLNHLYRKSPEAFGGYAMAAKTGTATVETGFTKRSLARKAWSGHSENILNLVVMGPIGPSEARYVVALTAPHPRAKDKRFISAGRVLGRHGVQMMRFLLDRDRIARAKRSRIHGAKERFVAGPGDLAPRLRVAPARDR